MLKLTLNRLQLDLHIKPVTPLLIKAGDKGSALLHPERPDLSFVRTYQNDLETVYIPGASIKGVIRSSAERVLRTIGSNCCDPMNQKNSCHKDASERGDKIAKESNLQSSYPQAEVYKMLCYACRTFGCQAMASHIYFADAYPSAQERDRTNDTERRNGVCISRQTGGPDNGKLFDMEVVTGGGFETKVHINNVQLWQVGLIGIVLRDIQSGLVRFGSAKSRGLGHVTIEPQKANFEQVDVRKENETPAGIACLRTDLVTPYDLLPADTDRLASPGSGRPQDTPLGRAWTWSGDEVWEFLDSCAGQPWQEFYRKTGGHS